MFDKGKNFSDFKGNWLQEHSNSSNILFVLLICSTLNPSPLNPTLDSFNILAYNYRACFNYKASDLTAFIAAWCDRINEFSQ